jgi:uncharacterized MAPEG superfamily protein
MAMTFVMDTPTTVVAASLFATYLNWWVALIIMRTAQRQNAAAAAASADAASGSRAVAYDNKDPSKSKEALTGYGKRALMAMNNHAEQLPHFAIAALLNLVIRGGAAPWPVASCMVVIAVARFLHLVFYITNLDGLRSLVFTVSGVATIALYSLVFVTTL